MQLLKWDDLRCLLAVERAGTLSGAARLLRVDQTTVGSRLDALQVSLGTSLVERDEGGCRLTAAGSRAASTAARMDEAALELGRDIGGLDAGVDGTVRVATAGGFVPVLAGALRELRERYPRLRLELNTGTALVNMVRRDADLAIRMTRDNQPSLLAKRVGHIQWGLYASESYLRRRGPVRSLDGHDLIGFGDVLGRTTGGQWLARHAAGAKITVRVSDLLSGLAAAVEGMGVIATPAFLVARESGLMPVHRTQIGGADFFLVTHRELARIPRVRAVIDHLTPYIRQRAALFRIAG